MSSCRNDGRNVQLFCSPLSSLVDRKVKVAIEGLLPNQEISLQAKLRGDSQDRYRSLAHYVADDQGRVCLSSHPSVGGSYTGVEPMGFMWSLKPEPDQKPGRRLLKKDVTKPYLVTLDVLDGHVRDQQYVAPIKPLASVTIERHYMGPGVRRVEVREGRIRGSLFLPRGEGPFQGVIELLGSIGGLYEFKAALLASNGFAALALAYFSYEDLPKLLEDVELEYFQEAAHWLSNHPQVIPGGVGVVGISKGADFSLLLAANSLDVAANVWISGHFGLCFLPSKYKGKTLPHFPFESSNKVVEQDGSMSSRDCCNGTWQGDISEDPTATPVEHIQCPLLLVYGSDDRSLNAEFNASKIYKRMDAFGKADQCSFLGYHGAGHLIEPPYTPSVFMSYHKTIDSYLAWGGETKAHAMAQEHAWAKILSFFRENLPQKSSSKL